MNELLAHRAEFLRALNNFHFERTPRGIYFPRQRALIGGIFAASVNGGPKIYGSNLVVDECLDDVLKVYFDRGAQAAAFYLAPYSGDVDAQAGWTGSGAGTDFTTEATEFTAYNEATRPVWANDDEADKSIGNSTTPGRCTLSAGGPYTIHGASLLSGSAVKGNHATTKLHAADRFDNALAGLPAGTKLDLEYIVGAADGG